MWNIGWKLKTVSVRQDHCLQSPAISENIDRGTEKHGNSGGMGLLGY